MQFKPLTLLVIAFILSMHPAKAQAQNKMPLNHSVYDSWNELKNARISTNGHYVVTEKQPFRGDGSLLLYKVTTKTLTEWPRGYQAAFAGNDSFLAFKVKPMADTLRKQKLQKKKEDQLSKDSLNIYVMQSDTTLGFGPIKSFKMPEKGKTIAIHFDKQKPANKSVKDTTKKEDKPRKSKKKANGTRLQILDPIQNSSKEFAQVIDYECAAWNDVYAINRSPSDSLDSCYVAIHSCISGKTQVIFKDLGFVQKLSISNDGDQLAFLYSPDTSKTKVFALYHWNSESKAANKLIDSTTTGIPSKYIVSEHFMPWFSEQGDKLFFGTYPKPVEEPKDTLLPEEKAKVDVWAWNDPTIMPEQLSRLDKDKKKSYLSVYIFDNKKFIQLATADLPQVNVNRKTQTNFLLATTELPYGVLKTWDDTYYDYYLIDLKQAKTKPLITKCKSDVRLSLTGKYLVYWDSDSSNWMCMQTTGNKVINLTKPIPYKLYNEEHDAPSQPSPYGLIGFAQEDKVIYISDRYDIWAIDPKGIQAPYRITGSYGRSNKVRLTYRNLNPDLQWIDFETNNILVGTSETTKQDALYKINPKSKEPIEMLLNGPYKLTGLAKAKEADRFIFMRQNFNVCPELYLSDPSFNHILQLTNTNPQSALYNWGTVELVKWLNPAGNELEGLLYKPDGFEAHKEYPMIVYFYERNSDNLYSYHSPRPSRSVINIPYFVSNGYLVFVPDITYEIGKPGKSAYDCIVSGTLALCQKGFVDVDHIGLQGQSWGGYQVAYLITQTNMFACAMAGAPVANMTSAYGGIRWESGISRMFQYEKAQSRIGKTLWEAPLEYIENSPLFHADHIKTPLLIMSNDNDGAVPWYQGIELYSAMRRFEKPAWLLNYNGDEHNLKAENYGNRLDLSIRMTQFFDHYLKGAPAPNWMKYGVPAIKKGIETSPN